MKIIFVRHGHAEHLNNYPNQLDMLHPALTEHGKTQVKQLSTQVNSDVNDLILASPTRRTIESAFLLRHQYDFTVSPLVGPRMFPQNNEMSSLLCDRIYTKEDISHKYKHIQFLDLDTDFWTDGINQIEQTCFEKSAMQLLRWIQNKYQRVFIISHDGTITNYRILLGETGLTRKDFLGEAGVYSMNV